MYASSTLAVACPRLVLLLFHLASCSFLVAWPMMLGIMAVIHQKDYCTFYWQWHVQGLFCWPLHFAMCSLTCLAGPDARHFGRYEPERPIRVLHSCSHARCVQRPWPLVTGCRKLWILHSCTVIFVPVYRSCRFPSWRRGIFPWSRLLFGPSCFPCCTRTRCSVPVLQVVQVSQVTPAVLGQVVVLVWWRFHRSSSWTRLWCLQVLWSRQCLPTGGPQLQFIMVVVIHVITQRQTPWSL